MKGHSADATSPRPLTGGGGEEALCLTPSPLCLSPAWAESWLWSTAGVSDPPTTTHDTWGIFQKPMSDHDFTHLDALQSFPASRIKPQHLNNALQAAAAQAS